MIPRVLLLLVCVATLGFILALLKPVETLTRPVASAITSSGPTAAPGPLSEKERVLSETELNRQIAQALAQNSGRIPFHGVQVYLRPDGKVDVRGAASIAGRETDVQATLRLSSREGTLDVEIERIQAGALPLPAFIAAELIERATAAAGLSGLRGIKLPPDIASVAVRDGALVITQR